VRNAAALDQSHSVEAFATTCVVRMDEGLIGFSQHKDFVFLENPNIAPFRLMEAAEPNKMGFVVIDPTILEPGYPDFIPAREWETIGSTDPSKRLAFVTVSVGATPQDSTANMLAPILINYETMTARQVILAGAQFSARHPLL